MSSPAGRRSTGTGMHPPTASVAAARAHAAANGAAGKQGLEAVQTMKPRAGMVWKPVVHKAYLPVEQQLHTATMVHGAVRSMYTSTNTFCTVLVLIMGRANCMNLVAHVAMEHLQKLANSVEWEKNQCSVSLVSQQAMQLRQLENKSV